MSDLNEGGRSREATTLSRPGNFGLDPRSYTAQRLARTICIRKLLRADVQQQHATPQHLHITSRRCFIGPVPEAWLSKHRKSWYQYRPHHVQNYTSKAASFTAGQTFGELRQLSGLDGITSNQRSHVLSFPQPSDVDGELPAEDGEPEHTGPSSSLTHQEAMGSRTGSKNGQAGRKSLIRGKMRIPTKSSSGQSDGGPVSGPQSTGRSFVTANEYAEGTDRTNTSHRNGQNSTETPGASPAASDPSNGSNGGHPELQGGPSDTGKDGVDSTSSLLPHDGVANGEGTTSKPTQGSHNLTVTVTAPNGKGEDNEAPGQAENDPETILCGVKDPGSKNSAAHLDAHPEVQAQSSPGMRQLDPVSTGLVRFNLPTDQGSEHSQSKLKISDAGIMKSFRDMSKARAQPGQLLKAERMLVRVDSTRQEVPAGYSENDSLKVETKLVEKWREYIVVCRRSTEPGPSLVLRMETTRVIPVFENQRSPRKPAHEIALDPKTAKINMYSALDKSIVMWAPRKKETRIYLFRPRSFASSVEWYTFLHTALGWKRSPSVTVHVPYLDMIVEIEKPFKELDINREASKADGKDGPMKDRGAKPLAEGLAAQMIIDRSLEMLLDTPSSDIARAWVEKGERIGLAWKRYDRLEWIHGANEERMYGSLAMAQTHDLELRPKTHYPTSVYRASYRKKPIEEPPAVEGFLVRLTSQRGRGSRFGRPFSKRLYYSTHNQYFCFSTPGTVDPPKPPHLPSAGSGDVPSSADLAEKIPKIYMVDPYPLADGEISWLSGLHAAKREDHDQSAFEESERTVRALMEANGYINLCHVAHVRKGQAGTAAQPPQGEEGDDHRHDPPGSDSESDDQARAAEGDAIFEIVLRNRLVVRLQAYDKETRREWVKRLRSVAQYWRLRMAEDMGLYRTIRKTNLERLDLDEGMEAYLGQYAQKWEVSRAVTSPELFNVCEISCCRSLTVRLLTNNFSASGADGLDPSHKTLLILSQMAGVLYRKPRLHSTFKKCNVLLVHGRLLIFQSTLRTRSGQEVPHTHHERLEAIELRDTYVYSGLAVESELLYRNQTFDSNHPGHHALPRVYPADRWTSTDEDTATCFVLWRSLRKSLFRARTEDAAGAARQHLARVSRLGTTGRAAVFQARSRTERDRWVTSIGVEIERLQQAADIRVVPKR